MADSTWDREKRFEEGEVIVEVTSQPGKFGKKYSISIGRKATNRETQEEYSSRFLRPRDLEIVQRLCESADKWLSEEDSHQSRVQVERH